MYPICSRLRISVMMKSRPHQVEVNVSQPESCRTNPTSSYEIHVGEHAEVSLHAGPKSPKTFSPRKCSIHSIHTAFLTIYRMSRINRLKAHVEDFPVENPNLTHIVMDRPKEHWLGFEFRKEGRTIAFT